LETPAHGLRSVK